ncbi:MaoC family dehydratase [Limibacillus halophilus]|uniref:2-methylfumaryl-CoA hydratase n=1 Tax=Limibacillus halophilus TaxID=1579333 RepID=A0A839SNV9_9PROT|nr:MaoC family dehydratase [Limibacillus halophilus]MBB3063878.1 2-methylfumaryl-CoA hydratase [Limibacillus halophilus]
MAKTDTGCKTNSGRFFEDFRPGETLVHATPRTATSGDQALYTALYGSRFALNSADSFAQGLGLARAPLDDLLVFHLVFGKSVPDISLNAVANLGYADGRFLLPVFPGDSLTAVSKVIGRKENSSGKTGTVYVETTGHNQRGEAVLRYTRWVMVHKRDAGSAAPEPVVPSLPDAISADQLIVPENMVGKDYDTTLSGSPHLWEGYSAGEKIDHVDGMTIEEAEHQLATRLYHNTARVHFNQHAESGGRFGKRIVYGGHVISIARALSFNGLANALNVAAINGGRHCNPTFGGDTIYAWSEVLDSAAIPARNDIGALRLRTVATKNRPCQDHPFADSEGRIDPATVLELDYWVLMPRR